VSAALLRSPSLAARLGRAIGVMLVFVAAGPPIGFLALTLLAAITSSRWGKFDPVFDLIHSPLDFLLGTLLFGYAFGAGPLALAGLAIGTRQACFGPAPWWMALGMGLVAGVVLVEILGAGFELDPDHPARYVVLVLSCVVPVMLCWRMLRNWYFAPVATKAVP
jgi:hypothetical protein